MARPFTVEDGKKAIEEYKKEAGLVESVISWQRELSQEIVEGCDALVTQKSMEILRGIPVDEINREKKGFRIRTLKENGYLTVADIAAASVDQIGDIQGVSREAAIEMKKVAAQMMQQVKKGVYVRLSADDRSKEAVSLVTALAKYQKAIDAVEEARKLLNEIKQEFTAAVADITAVGGRLRWFFSFPWTKRRAAKAYEHLRGASFGEFWKRAERLADEKVRIGQRISVDEAYRMLQEDSVAFVGVLEQICPDAVGDGADYHGLPNELALEVEKEAISLDGLRCSLRRYQEVGVKYCLHQKNVLLGDEMGLGKTIQAIAVMAALKNRGETHFCVVCPASVIANWCREIERWSELDAYRIHGKDRGEAFKKWMLQGGVGITTYELAGEIILADDFNTP